MSRYVTSDDEQVVAERFGQETFIVNFRKGRYYALRGSSTAIWELLGSPQTARSIVEQLALRLRNMPPDAVSEISTFLSRLEAEGLVSQTDLQPLSEPTNIELAAGSDYQSPDLEVFDDLSELIVIDPVHEVDDERGWPIQVEE